MRMNSGTAVRPRKARRIGAALALSAAVLGTGAAAASAAPSLTLTPASNLDAAGQTVTVRGRGFLAPDVPSGIYVAQTAVVNGRVIVGASQKWVWSMGAPSPTQDRLNADGSFETGIDVVKTLGSGADSADCSVVQCYISAWPQHSNPTTASIYAKKPVLFRLAAPVTPAITVTPRTGLSRDGDSTVTISGTGFDPNVGNGNGFYIAYGPRGADYWTVTAGYGATKWVRPGDTVSANQDILNPDGSFSTTLTFSPTYTGRDTVAYDCRVTECSIITFAAQGSSDRTFDTATPLAFAPPTPKAEISPATELDRDAATTVTVRGSDFSTGLYVSQTAIVDGQVAYDQAKAKWVRRGAPTPDQTLSDAGGFETTVQVTPTFTFNGQTVDCRVTQCAISTWRQHSNPTPAALYTTAPVTFKAAPIVIPPPEERRPTPDPRSTPSIKVAAKAQGIAKNGTALIAALSCKGDAACSLAAPKTVTLKIGKKSYRLTVVAPKSLKGGKSARVYVKLPKQAIAGLTGRSAKVKVKLTLKSGATTATKTATVTVKGRKAAKKAVKKAAQKRS